MDIRGKIWGTGKQATQEEVIELTNQFYVTLRAYLAQIKNTGAAGSLRNKDAFERIQALLEAHDGQLPVQNWTSAYEVEQLFVHLFDDETVTTELRVRLLEARSILRPELATMYEATIHDIENPPAGTSPASTAGRRRSLLARLVNDLQWRYIVNEAKRRYSKLITRRTATLSMTALVVFVGVVMFIVAQRVHFVYGDLRLLWIAALTGTWGATFSMLVSLKSRLDQSHFDDLKLMKSGAMLLSRAAIGAGAASILFFFLLSGLLGGTAFPELIKPTPTPQAGTPAAPVQAPAETTPETPARTNGTDTTTDPNASEEEKANRLPTRALAMLIVWCFIAGFSEQLIPGLLASTEARAGAPAQSATDRFRPTTGAAPVPSTAGGGQQTANPTQTGAAQQPQAPAPQSREEPPKS